MASRATAALRGAVNAAAPRGAAAAAARKTRVVRVARTRRRRVRAPRELSKVVSRSRRIVSHSFDDMEPRLALVDMARDYHARGWLAGAAGNLSARDRDDGASFWIAADLEARFRVSPPQVPALMIHGHGATVWGASMQEAYYRVEIVEFLLRYLAHRR